MPKPKAEAWLREAFRDGVDERGEAIRVVSRIPPAYDGANPLCWLADFDKRRRPCVGPIERFHFIRRQAVEDRIGFLLSAATIEQEPDDYTPSLYAMPTADAIDLTLLAAWDARNGGHGCEGHHRRFDNHATPELLVPWNALPSYVLEFIFERDVETAAVEKFPA